MLALLLCLTACEEDLLVENGIDRPLAEGEFIVDYAADGLDTRSIHANMPKNARISSLTYLLYSIDGTLLKRREIPNIGPNTVWPLRRETMTWAQREALKDTLTTQKMNSVVFAANIDPKKCGWEKESPLKDADNLKNAYLELPSRSFNDGNMFYLFVRDTLVNNMTGVDRDHPLNCPVILHRVVTRTDFFTEEFPMWETIDNMDVVPQPGDTVYNYMAYYARNIYVENLKPSDEKLTLIGSLEKEQNEFLQLIYKYFNDKYSNSGILDRNKEKYDKLRKNVTSVQDYLKTHSESTQAFLVEENRSNAIFSLLMNDCLLNQELRNCWKTTWRNGKWAELSYKNNNGVNQFFLDKKNTSGNLATSAKMKVDTSLVITDPIYHFSTSYCGFSHIGFANPERNVLSAINWYREEDAQTALPNLALSTCDTLTTQQQGNEWYEVRYQPMQPLSYNCPKEDNTGLVKPYGSEYDLKKGLPFKDALRKEDMSEEDLEKLVAELVKAIKEEALPNLSSENKQKYWPKEVTDSLSQVTLTIQYPDLSKDGALVFNGKWNIRKVQGGTTK